MTLSTPPGYNTIRRWACFQPYSQTSSLHHYHLGFVCLIDLTFITTVMDLLASAIRRTWTKSEAGQQFTMRAL